MKVKFVQDIIDKIRGKKQINNVKQSEINKLYRQLDIDNPISIQKFKSAYWQDKDNAHQYYDVVEHPFFDAVSSKYFLEYIKPTDKVLDCGAGTGRLSMKISEITQDVTAQDISQEMLNHIENKNIKTVCCDAEKIPFEDNSFNVVTSFDLICHLVDWRKYLKEQLRLVKSGGYLIFSAYNGNNYQKISPNRDMREILDKMMYGSQYIVNQTKEELTDFANNNNAELVKIQPYNLLAGTALWCENLSAYEIYQLRELYVKTYKNPQFLELIRLFEERVVKDMNSDDCMHMIVVIKKK